MIRPDKDCIEGQWLSNRGCTVRDATCERITNLIETWLRRAGTSPQGLALFEDPGDGRLWALSYPHGGMRGGGPPRLECVAPARHGAWASETLR